jgi:hypothetical protein
MALKIRRGPNSDRLTYTPSQGELIFTTDTKLVYVGDGTTTGGIAISSGAFTLVNDTSPTLGANLNLNSKNIIGTGNINITGNISGTNLTLSGNLITSSSLTGPATNPEVVIGSAAPSSGSSSHTLTINAMGSNPPLRLKTLTGGLGNISRALFQGVGGTYANPTLPTLGDYIGGLNFSSSNGTSLIPTASILARSDPNGTMSSTLADGKLEFISKDSLQNIVENQQQKQPQQNKKTVSFNQQEQYHSQNIQQPQISKNSYIYNKFFKDYKEPSLIQNEEPMIPLTKSELIKQLIINKVNTINERNRIAQIKSTKLLFNNNNNRNIIINSTPNPNGMNHLFNFR